MFDLHVINVNNFTLVFGTKKYIYWRIFMIITVPAGVCPLHVIAEMGEKIKDARIFLHDYVIRTLRETANCIDDSYEGAIDYLYFEDECYISVSDTPSCKTWHKVLNFEYGDLYHRSLREPKLTVYVKMA